MRTLSISADEEAIKRCISGSPFHGVFAKPFDVAIRKEGCASEVVAENLPQQKSQFELSS